MDTQYKVSVVTPFHNVDMSMFDKCAASMRAQTIGFPNVQWVIVLHNCEPTYLPQLQEMFRNEPNVELVELNNEVRTPSSPRNHGMKFVTAPYVGYLDGDDSYLPECLEVALREGTDSQSDIVSFRRENELEDTTVDGSKFISTVMWNNLRKRIIVEQGEWDYEKMFSGAFGFVTNNLFRTQFLRDEHLVFSDEMSAAEDILFLVNAIGHSKRICYLPQLIGYHYFINSQSMVQKGDKSADTMIRRSKSHRLLYETMRSYGIDTQEYSQGLGSLVAADILRSPSLTVDDRKAIKEIYGPDALAAHLIPPRKPFSAESRRTMLTVLRDVILNPENPGVTYMKGLTDGTPALAEILTRNADTDMGRSYNFNLLDLRAYRNRVPLTDWEFYRPLVNLQTHVGEYNLITADPVVRYLASSNGELIPFTQRQSRTYAECLGQSLKGKKNILLVRSHPVSARTNDGAVVDTLNSAIVKDYFCNVHFRDGIPQALLASPVESYFAETDSEDDFFDLIVDALAERNAQQLVAFTAKELLAAFQILETRWKDMVRLMPAGERRDEVQRILSEGFNQPIAQRLWPSLERVVCFGAGKMSDAMQQLRHYIGDMHHNHGYDYLKSAVMGKAVADNSDLFVCIKNHAFYEFLPVDASADQDKTRLWSELEIGKAYRVVVTNHSGLYRYRTGHVIIPQEVSPITIKFTIA